MPDLQTLLERNQKFAAEYKGGLKNLPKFSTFILICADHRVDPAYYLGLELGDALVFRTGGGRVTDDVKLEIGILWTMVARKSGESFPRFSVALIQHTDCGFERLANPEWAAEVRNQLGLEQAQIDRLANADHARRIREDIECLRKSRLVPKELVVSGYIYHVEDGTLEEVVAPASLKGM